MTTDPRTEAARLVLVEIGNGAGSVAKPVRSGFTTSTVYAAAEMGKKLLCIQPTTRIILETIGSAGGSVRVPGNHECPILSDEIEAYPILKELPLSLPDCEKCPNYEICPVTEVLRRPDFNTVAITYAKIQALLLANSTTKEGKLTTAGKIRHALQKVDIVLLDEAHLLGFGSVASVVPRGLPVAPSVYVALTQIRTIWNNFLIDQDEAISDIEERAKEGHAWQHLSRQAVNDSPLHWRALRAAWGELRTLAKSGEMDRDGLLMYRDVIDILSYPLATVHYVTEDEGRDGQVRISGSRGKGQVAIRRFLQNTAPYAGHVFVSGTLIEPTEDYFAELCGKDTKALTFPDVMRTSRRVTLIPDTWKLSARNFHRKLPDIVDQIRQIVDREKEPVYCICMNAAKAGEVRKAIRRAGISGVTVDYYRSDLSIGVARPERICIAIGMAELPTNSLDPQAWGRTSEERWANSRALRLQAVHAATWQSINRVRDPEGKIESRIYLIGVRCDEAKQLSRWGPARRVEVTDIKDTITHNKKPYRTATFNVTVDEEIEHCNLFGEDAMGQHSDRRTLTSMVEKIELYDEDIIFSENHSISPILIYRGNGVKLGIYNIPSNTSEVESTATSLYNTFCHRSECYAQQLKDSSGKWGFSKVNRQITRDNVIDHINGKATIGTYEIGLDDTVIWGCFDIDSHKEGDDGTEAREKVRDLADVMGVYGIPYMLEASGSPGSYHIWILFKRTDTYNAYRFMRQLAREAKIKGIEVWPKQKRLGKDGKYGNLVKLPICLHNKTGNRSAFVDVATFEPLEGEILVPGRVVLLKVPDLTTGGGAMPKPRKVSKIAEKPSSATLDHCMINALADKLPLEGDHGHALRVAIAVKAAFIGMSREDAAMLFKDQPDFKYEYSLYKATEIGDRGHSPWSCETLRDKCGEFVTRSCPSCPFASPRLKGVNIA